MPVLDTGTPLDAHCGAVHVCCYRWKCIFIGCRKHVLHKHRGQYLRSWIRSQRSLTKVKLLSAIRRFICFRVPRKGSGVGPGGSDLYRLWCLHHDRTKWRVRRTVTNRARIVENPIFPGRDRQIPTMTEVSYSSRCTAHLCTLTDWYMTLTQLKLKFNLLIFCLPWFLPLHQHHIFK